MTIKLTSLAFSNNGRMAKSHTGEGEDRSPALAWSGVPAAAKSLALIMEDPDAPSRSKPLGVWVHWLIYGLSADIQGLPENFPKKEILTNGSKQGLVWGFKDSECHRVGYYGPLPPPGSGPHRYFFKLYAFKDNFDLPPKATKSQLIKAMEGKILSQAELIGIYQR